jgi:hypothetical protein
MTADGQCWELPTLERRTKETGSGCVPNGETFFHTPNTNGLDGGSNSRRALQKRQWPTPTASQARSEGMILQMRSLVDAGVLDRSEAETMISGSLTPPRMEKWPTPTVCGNYNRKGLSERSGDGLATAVMKCATPTARDWRSDKASQATMERNSRPLSEQIGGSLNPDWVEWLMNWPITWSSINAVNPKEFKRWSEASAAALQESACMRTMWWDSDPSQASSGSQHIQQPEQQCGGALQQMPRGAACQPPLEGSHQGQDLPVLREDLHLHQGQGEDMQQGMRQQTGMDEAPFAPRVANGVTARVDRLKAIGNGQVPLCVATAWRLLTETA